MTSPDGRRGRNPLQGLSALVTLLVLVAGLPLLLMTVTGLPQLPSTHSLEHITDTLTSRDDGTLFLGVLTWIAWIAWLVFALNVLTELLWQARGLRAPRLHLPGQRAASSLVTAVLLMLGAAPAMAAAAPPAAAATTSVTQTTITQTSITAPAHGLPGQHAHSQLLTHTAAGGTGVPTSAAQSTAPATPTSRTASAATSASTAHTTDAVDDQDALNGEQQRAQYVVKHGDTLWGIAERELGDGRLFTQIAKLNYGVPQPDGGHLTSSHWVQPGWVLQMPKTAQSRTTQPEEHQQRTHVVQPGETLSGIAAEELGSPQKWVALAEASHEVVQPDGQQLTDPDLIQPGWRIIVPDAKSSAKAGHSTTGGRSTTTHAEPAPPTSPASQTPSPSEPTQAPTQAPAAGPASSSTSTSAATAVPSPTTDQPAPSVSVPLSPQQAPAATSSQEVPQPGSTAPQQIDDQGGEAPAPVMAAGIGAVLAGAVLLLLAAKRARQQRRRRPGERIPRPDAAAATVEHALRVVEDPVRVELVDVALRHLARDLRDAGLPLPQIRAARLTATDLELTLGAPAELVHPWQPVTEHQNIWFVPVDAIPSGAIDQPASYPCLVTVGVDDHNAHILLDLEHIGSLAVTGSEAATTSVLRAMALELALSRTADDLQITIVGLAEELPAALGTGRLRAVQDIAGLVEDLERRADDTQDLLEQTTFPDMATARASAGTADAWTPEVLILATRLDDATQERLASVVSRLPRLGVAAVTTNATDMGGWHLHLRRDSDLALLTHLGVHLRPQRVDDEAYQAILDLYATADGAADATAPAWAPVVRVDEVPVEALPTPSSLPTVFTSFDPLLGSTGPHPAAGEDELDVDEPGRVHDLRPAQHADDAAADPGQDFDSDTNDQVHDGDATVHQLTIAPRIRLLGPVDVDNVGELSETSKRGQLTEIAAWINLHPGADHHLLSEAIWPGNRATTNTRNTAMSKLRRWLGQTPDGIDYLPRVSNEGYRLHPAVRSDWDLWQQLVADPTTENLQEALNLVRGQPLSGVNPRRYVWAEFLRQEMISSIVDVAHELASRALQRGDAPAARRAAHVGRLADAVDERLWRDSFKAEYLAGNKAGIEELADKLTGLLEDAGSDMEPETVELLTALLQGRPSSSRAHA